MKTDISFLCVQPIDIESDVYTNLLLKKIPFSVIDKYCKSGVDRNSLQWMTKYKNIYSVYEQLKEVNIDYIDMEYLVRDLSEDKHSVKNNSGEILQLDKYLNTDKTKYTLYFDPRFSYFILVYEIFFTFQADVLSNFLDYSGKDNNHKKRDFYNTIRNLIVVENDKSVLSSWGRYIQKSVAAQIQGYIRKIYKLKILDASVTIPTNSCNISAFIFDSRASDNEYITKFNELNKYAERMTSNTKMESLYDDTVFYSFNGRFHTIILKNEQDYFRFQPLQFHIQYMWFLVERYNKLMNNINLDLMQEDSLKKLQKYTKIIHTLINKIELLSLHDSDFKHSIEVDYQTIYKKNEERWSIQALLQSSKQYINFFKDYLDRLFSQKNELFQKKQNYILLFISLVQILALISVWTDYLSIANKENIKNIDTRIMDIFHTSSTLLSFNIYLPVILLGSVGILVLYLFVRNNKS